jgi:flavin-dependent dehydrogenase
MVLEKVDVCIIGAGPAGAPTSLFLSKKGISHLILDAAVFPRDKICGDGLDLKVMRVLRQLDPSFTEAEIFENEAFVASWGTRFFTQNGRSTDFIYTPKPGDPHPHPIFLVSKRLHFDHYLVKKINPAFADFRSGVLVNKVEKTVDGWRLEAQGPAGALEIHCKLLIGADGDHSVVLRALGERGIDRQHYAGTLRQYCHPLSKERFYFLMKYIVCQDLLKSFCIWRWRIFE